MNAARSNWWVAATMGVALLSSCATRESIPPSLPAEAPFNREAGRAKWAETDWLYLALSLDTREDLLFCLETGSPITVLDKSLEPLLGRRLGEMPLHYVWRDATGGRYKAPKLYLGTTRLQTGDSVWTDDFRQIHSHSWTNAAGRPVMGVLGLDCLRNCCVQLDFMAVKARFLDSKRVEPEGLGKAFRLTVYPPGPNGYAAIHGNFTGTEGVRPLIDTGCLVDGVLDPQEFQLALRTYKAAWTNECTDPLGFQRCTAFFPKAVFAGETYPNLTLERAPCLVVKGKTNYLNAVGLPFLARHVVTLDFPKKTIYLQRTDAGTATTNAPSDSNHQ